MIGIATDMRIRMNSMKASQTKKSSSKEVKEGGIDKGEGMNSSQYKHGEQETRNRIASPSNIFFIFFFLIFLKI